MDLTITVTRRSSLPILLPLLQACNRRGCVWSLFLTGDGATLANQSDLIALSQDASYVHVCQESWNELNPEVDCQMPLGSQTNHSENVARANRVVSL